MVPLMVALLKLRQHLAHGTSLAIIVPLALAGVIPYLLKQHLDWGLVSILVVGSIVGVVIGAKAMVRIPARRLRQGFGVLYLLVSARLLALGTTPLAGAGFKDNVSVEVGIGLGLGLLAGVLGGLLGIGGGVVLVPGLVLLLGQVQQGAQGISLATMAIMGIVGSYVQNRQELVSWRVTFLATPTAIACSIGGGFLAVHVNADLLSRLFGGLLVFTGFRLLLVTPKSEQQRAKQAVAATSTERTAP